ncbi:MAG: large subunit ribosomal protein, partial [Verrucomicrobiota bacterium]
TGVKNFGGLLDQNLRLLPIECLPGDLPDRITVDVSALNIGDAIHVRDIKLPPGVTAKVQLDLTAFSVMAPVIEEEPVAAEAEAAAAAGPEVITAKKEEGEEAAPAAGAKGAAGAGAKGAGAPAGKGGGPAPKEKEQKK